MNVKSPFSLKKLLVCSAVAMTMSAGLSVTHAGMAYAQDDEKPVEGRQFGAKAGQKVLDAQNLMSEDRYSEALTELNAALQITNLNPYERGIIYQMQGSVFYELNRYADAIRAFENAIRSGGLLPKESDALKVNIAQLLIQDGQYVRGATAMETYLNAGGQQKPQYLDLLVSAWVQAENFRKALPWAEKWFNQARSDRKLERKHFDLLNYLYNTLGMPGKQADIVKQMIVRWPEDKTLWDTWASMLANGGREQEAFEVNKMLYLGGALRTEQDLMKVVQYYSFYDMPFQAANILEREMNRGRIQQSPDKLVQLSDLFRQAREYKRAIPILDKAAASSGKAKLYADLGEALYNEGQCVRAEDAFTNAIDRGFDAGKAWMLIGTCRYESSQKEARPDCENTTKEQRTQTARAKKRNNAIQAFNNVPRSSREKRNANKWVSFITAEGQAVENRCQFILDTERELCFIKIKQAYDAEIFTNGFKLEDESCLPFKQRYDDIYRVRVSEDG